MDFDHLRVFVYAAQILNFSKTAQRLNLSQPTVSKYIQQLEHDLGVRLFEREKGKLRLSQEGHTLLPKAQQLIREYHRFEQMAHSLHRNVYGALSLACDVSSGKYLLPMLAARFRQRFPEVKIEIQTCTVPDVSEMLLQGELDLGITSAERDIPGLETQPCCHDEIVLIVPADHPWSRRGAAQPEDLFGETIISYPSGSDMKRILTTAFARHDIALDELHPLLELGCLESIIYNVAAGIGIAFVPRRAVSMALEAKRVALVPVEGMSISRALYVARNNMNFISRPAEVFWSFVRDPENADLLGAP